MNSASRYPRAIELLPKYLFNRCVISLPQMSAARIAEAAGASAQTRIDSDGRLETHPLHRVFPTQVGVILTGLGIALMTFSFPHTSGGDPQPG